MVDKPSEDLAGGKKRFGGKKVLAGVAAVLVVAGAFVVVGMEIQKNEDVSQSLPVAKKDIEQPPAAVPPTITQQVTPEPTVVQSNQPLIEPVATPKQTEMSTKKTEVSEPPKQQRAQALVQKQPEKKIVQVKPEPQPASKPAPVVGKAGRKTPVPETTSKADPIQPSPDEQKNEKPLLQLTEATPVPASSGVKPRSVQTEQGPAAQTFEVLAVMNKSVAIRIKDDPFPIEVKVGGTFPNGEILVSIDQKRGIAKTDRRELKPKD